MLSHPSGASSASAPMTTVIFWTEQDEKDTSGEGKARHAPISQTPLQQQNTRIHVASFFVRKKIGEGGEFWVKLPSSIPGSSQKKKTSPLHFLRDSNRNCHYYAGERGSARIASASSSFFSSGREKCNSLSLSLSSFSLVPFQTGKKHHR